jgi:hypothetical protein
MQSILIALLALQLSTPNSEPKMGWKKLTEETVALTPRDKPFSWKLPFREGVRLKFDVDAAYGVTFLVRDPKVKIDRKDAPKLPCFATHVLKVSAACVTPIEFAAFVMTDERSEGPQNRVNLVLSVWTCIENCPLKKAASN